MKRTRLLPLARAIALPFIGYVIHKHGPSTGNKVCAVPRTAYITSTTIPPSFLSWFPTCFPTSNLCTYLLTNINYLLAFLSTYLPIYLPTYLPYCLILPSFLSPFFNTYSSFYHLLKCITFYLPCKYSDE